MLTGKVRGVKNSKRGPIKLSSNRRFTASRSGIVASNGSRQINGIVVFLLCFIIEHSLEAHLHWFASSIYNSTQELQPHHKNGFPCHTLVTIPSQVHSIGLLIFFILVWPYD